MGKTQTAKYMDFAGALKALKDGKKVRREAWFAKAEYIYLKTYEDESDAILVHWKYSLSDDTLWVACHHEYFANDWMVVE